MTATIPIKIAKGAAHLQANSPNSTKITSNMVRQLAATSAFIEALILDMDAALIPPTNRAVSRTPLPFASISFTFAAFAVAIGGRPNLTLALLAVA